MSIIIVFSAHHVFIRPQFPPLLGLTNIISAYNNEIIDPIQYSKSLQQSHVLCVFLKNKSQYLKEWLDFHFTIGWNHVMLFDHGSTDDLLQVLQSYSSSQVDYVPANWTGNARQAGFKHTMLQFESYNRCFEKHWQTSTIIATTDVDEFVYPCAHEKNISFADAIMEAQAPYGTSVVVQMECYRYGINGHLQSHTGNVLTSYSHRAAYQGDTSYQLPPHISQRCDEMTPFPQFCDRAHPSHCYSCKHLYFPNGKATPLFPTVHDFYGSAKRQYSAPARNRGFCCNHYFFLSFAQVIEKYRLNGSKDALQVIENLAEDDPVWEFYEAIEDMEIVAHFAWQLDRRQNSSSAYKI